MGEETTGLKQQILQLLHQVLQKTKLNYPPAIGSFLRIFYEMEGLELSPALIMSVAQASFNEQTGISLLEKQLQVQSSPERGITGVCFTNLNLDFALTMRLAHLQIINGQNWTRNRLSSRSVKTNGSNLLPCIIPSMSTKFFRACTLKRLLQKTWLWVSYSKNVTSTATLDPTNRAMAHLSCN